MQDNILHFDDIHFGAATQGETFLKSLALLDEFRNVIDVTQYTAKMQIRRNHDDLLIAELSTENGKITINEDGIVSLKLSYSDTSLMPAGTFLYDLRISDGSIVTRLLQGEFSVKPRVTY